MQYAGLIAVGASALFGIAIACLNRSQRPRAFFVVVGVPAAAIIAWYNIATWGVRRVPYDNPKPFMAAFTIVIVAGVAAAFCWAVTHVIRGKLGK